MMRKSTLVGVLALFGASILSAAAVEPPPTSYLPVVPTEDFAAMKNRMVADKPKVEARQKDLLEKRYDLSNRPAKGVTMSRGKAVQEGVRAKLPKGVASWEDLAALAPDAVAT